PFRSINDDAAPAPQVHLRHRSGVFVRSDAHLPPCRQSAGEDRLLDRIDGQVHGAEPGRADLGNRGLPDTGKAGDHDEVAGHAIFSEVVPTPAMKSSSGIVAGWSGTILSAVVNDLYSSGPASSPPRGSRNRRAYESERIP